MRTVKVLRKMRPSIYLAVLGLCSIFFHFQSFAQSSIEGILINAKNMEGRNGKVELQGDVQLLFDGQYLAADRATIDTKTNIIFASGSVVLKDPQTQLEADRAEFNYKTKKGLFFGALIRSGQIQFEGETLEKTGENEYIATKGVYTACVSCPAAWSFSGQTIKAEIGGYARISHPIMRLGGVPVLYLPGLIVPLKSDRQSGLLVPSYETSNRGGLAISEEFFWAISESQDMTLGLKNYEKRGLQGQMEYRYVLAQESEGSFRASWLQDQAFSNEVGKSNLKRWNFAYNHSFSLPDDFVQKVQFSQISDLRYLRDFEDLASGHGDPAIENKLSLSKNWDRFHGSIEANFNLNMLDEDIFSDNGSAIHRLPEIRYSILNRNLGETSLIFGMDVQYTRFARGGFSYDDVRKSTDPACKKLPDGKTFPDSCFKKTRDGEFEPEQGDLLRTGERTLIRPQVSYPIHFSRYLIMTPTAKWTEAYYEFPTAKDEVGFSSSTSRRYLESGLEFRTLFSRVFAKSDPTKDAYKHEFEPILKYSSIPWSKNSSHLFFGEVEGAENGTTFNPINDNDVFGENRLQFDYEDRLFDQETVDLTLSNRITRRSIVEDKNRYDNILGLRVSQGYNFKEARDPDSPQPWSAIRTLLDVRLRNFESNSSFSTNVYAGKTSANSRFRFIRNSGDYLQLSYSRNYSFDNENRVLDTGRTENYGLGLGFRSKYIDFFGELDYSKIKEEINGWKYQAFINPPGNCWTISLVQNRDITAGVVTKLKVDFRFDGVTSSSQSIPTY